MRLPTSRCPIRTGVSVLAHQLERLGRNRAGQTERLAELGDAPDGGRQHHDRVAHPGQLGHPVDQLRPADVVAPEDVSLPRTPAITGQQVPGGHVLDVDEVHRRVHHGGQSTAEVVADRPRRGLPRLRAIDRHPEHIAGIDHDQLDVVALGRLERDALTGVLRIRVHQPQPVLWVARRFIGRPSVGRPNGGDGGGQYHPADPLGGGGLHRDVRAASVQLPHVLYRARGNVAGDVEQDVAPAQRAPERAVVEHVGLGAPIRHAVQRLQALGVAVNDPYLVASLRERPGYMCAHETGNAGHAHLHLDLSPIWVASEPWGFPPSAGAMHRITSVHRI